MCFLLWCIFQVLIYEKVALDINYVLYLGISIHLKSFLNSITTYVLLKLIFLNISEASF